MIELRFNENYAPKYMTKHSAACDLYARESVMIEPGQRAKVATGVWISQVDWSKVPEGTIPELQIRARSGLAYKHGISLTNGIGTIDADFRDEICVLLTNTGAESFHVEVGMRIGQMTQNLVYRIAGLDIGGDRTGGFGSTSS